MYIAPRIQLRSDPPGVNPPHLGRGNGNNGNGNGNGNSGNNNGNDNSKNPHDSPPQAPAPPPSDPEPATTSPSANGGSTVSPPTVTSGGGPNTTTTPPTPTTTTTQAGPGSNTVLSATPPASSNSNQGPTGSGSDSNTGTVNSGNIPSENGGSSDLGSGTLTTSIDPSDSTPSIASVNSSTAAQSNTSGGSIAAAVIVTLLFVIGIVVFLLRRRSKARRDEQAIKWGFTRNRTSKSYDDNETFNFRNSSRSSFVTSFDHSNFSFSGAALPPLPPMAELGRANGTDPSLILDINVDTNRFSVGSANSDNSQYLVVHHRESLLNPSVTSCMESFPFPKPPPPDGSSLHSPKASEGHGPKKDESEVLYVASPGAILPTISFRAPTPSMQAVVLTNPFADNNPFDDPTSQLSAPQSGTPLRFETVRRPFFPQLQDELQVEIGESVRVIETYDDGWALVEKSSAAAKGLIPLECLRDPGQNVLLAGKRLSSQGATKT